MTCNEFNKQLAMLQRSGEMTQEMQEHMDECASCKETYEKEQLLFDFVEEEKALKISPFVTTRIMAQIERVEKPSRMVARPAFVSLLSVVVLILGFFSASLFSGSEASSLADSTEIIATDYFFSANPGSQIEDIWLNSYSYE
ncbi:hypothetical protein [Marinilabilia salmonicolor]|uniref:hypothetical protein n=1 Tax=Marinilabilia salmonicolor TaxID=989 RepID=UPI00029A5A97|nr:hypothetical protein [Marinilabilia salmonicolor]